jgi:L-histidine N-alpha-methyltransferase
LSPAYNTEVERPAVVTIHPSCFPDRTRAAYLESFRARRMDHRFHYESEKQAQQWLALHEACSPARTDTDCLATYNRAFTEVASVIGSAEVALVSVGCGGGQKDSALLKSFRAPHIEYVPSDVSLPLALTAHLRASKESPVKSKPLVLDLPASNDLPEFLNGFVPSAAKRIIAFFGMLPNFEPAEALEPLSAALLKDDILLLSANLAPGTDYASGVKKILPLYENDLTRRWLATALLDAGLDISPSDIEFSIESVGEFLRVEANYRFRKRQSIRLDREEFSYESGEMFRMFFSYRHTPDRLRALLANYRIEIMRQWITASEEEGVFLCKRLE